MNKLFRFSLKTILILFVLLNIVTAFHAYKFTHIYNREEVAIINPMEKTGWDKTKDLLFGAKAVKQQNPQADSTTEIVILTTKDSIKLEAWYIKATEAAKGTVLLFHGHLSKKGSVLKEARQFNKLGYHTLLVDFRAHGGSGGNTCTIGYDETEDVKLAYDFIKAKGETNIVLWGISMGAAAITKAMNDYPLQPSKLIVEMPFATLSQAAVGRIKMMGVPPQPLASLVLFWGGVEQGFWAFGMKPAEFVKTIKVPVLLQWGKNDPRVLQEETNSIYHNINSKKQLVVYETAAHESLCSKEPEKWIVSVSSFLNQ